MNKEYEIKMRWIPVDEELPAIEDGQLTSEMVLQCWDNGARQMGVYCLDGSWKYYDIGGVEDAYSGQVVAWMPLPESYREVSA